MVHLCDQGHMQGMQKRLPDTTDVTLEFAPDRGNIVLTFL